MGFTADFISPPWWFTRENGEDVFIESVSDIQSTTNAENHTYRIQQLAPYSLRRSDAAIAPSQTSPKIVTKKIAIQSMIVGYRLHENLIWPTKKTK